MQLIKIGAGLLSDNALALDAGWQLVGNSPGSVSSPDGLDDQPLDWLPAVVPGTVAQSLELAGQWTLDSTLNFDDQDWWYRCSFTPISGDDGSAILHFGGLATLAEVWLNDQPILTSDNMFIEQSLDVADLLVESNELVICFRSLSNALSVRRPRPQWKTNLVNHQQLRWFRSTMLGRIPGWTPPVAPVGPWRSVHLDHQPKVSVKDLNLNTSVKDGTGLVEFSCILLSTTEPTDISAVLSVCEQTSTLDIDHRDGQYFVSGRVEIEAVPLWWPHTHGVPELHQCSLNIQSPVGDWIIDCGEIGFRHIELLDSAGEFDFSFNGQRLFCRGACWTVADIVSLTASDEALEHYLLLAVEAGMNMVRIGGTMLYESDHFYSLCDKLGIMVWQDFMFANMDYPIDDTHFKDSVTREVTQQLQRLQTHPSLTLYCGNSEVEQQAAMLGIQRAHWRNELFATILPDLCHRWHRGVPYIPSTPSGGILPFHVGTGVTHYYGVGAYLRPLLDVKSAGVRFTSECLGFSNVPERSTVNKAMGDLSAVSHHPRWKSRVPRDTGASWDFEDVRDHYLERLFSVDVATLKYCDSERYFDLSRLVTGEVMSRVFSEWRREKNMCQGGLVWFYKDIWPGAGWGIVDSEGLPKACYYYLKRVWAAQAILLTDEGLDGLGIHVINDATKAIEGSIELQIIVDGSTVTTATKEVLVAAGDNLTLSSDALLDLFYDVTYAYRFGPPKHDVVVATLLNKDGEVLSEASYFPQATALEQLQAPQVTATARSVDDCYHLELKTNAFLQAVNFDVSAYLPDDNYFCLVPGRTKTVVFKPHGEKLKKFRCYVDALNLKHSIKVVIT